MEKVYYLKGLDCPHCADKIQKAVEQLACVSGARVNLMQQTLTVDGDVTLDTVVKIVHSYEPEVEVSENGEHPHQHQECDYGHNHREDVENPNIMLARFALGGALFVAGLLFDRFTNAPLAVILSIFLGAYGILGYDVVFSALKNMISGRVFDENFLMALASIGAFCIGEYHEAVAVMLFYQVGEYFQALSVRRSRKSIAQLLDIRPDRVTVVRQGQELVVSPEEVAVGETVLVRPGERIGLDGIVVNGNSTLDTAALTGESLPRQIGPEDTALSGCINLEGLLTVRVTKPYGESTAAKIISLVENASNRKAPSENFISTFARYYTPVVVILASLLALVPPLVLGGGWGSWLRRGLVFLVVSCPCALVISIPLTFFGGIGAASRKGVLVKGSNYLEALNSIHTLVLDKTGTLTEGRFQVTQIFPAPGFTREQVLSWAAEAEQYSNHPIAKSILAAWGKPGRGEIQDYREEPGMGVVGTLAGTVLVVGNQSLLESRCIPCPLCSAPGAKVYVSADGIYAGCILISDKIKADSKSTIAQLKGMGIQNIVMLTGDDEAVSQSVARELGISKYYAGLLPQDKVSLVEQLEAEKPAGTKVSFVGDGINDAPVLARADIGISMGETGADAAIEASDIVLMTDQPSRLVDAIAIARKTKAIVLQNIVLALGCKGTILLLSALGFAGMWAAVFADVGVAMIAVLNAMRMLKQ